MERSDDISRAGERRNGRSACAGTRCAFTLLELLVTIAIIGVLMSLVLPAAARTMATARSFTCKMGLRSVAFDFGVFADSDLGADRGEDSRLFGRNAFRLETFQESEYCIDEFWCWEGQDRVEMPDEKGNDPMRCPEVQTPLVLRSNAACTGGGVSPFKAVSYTFNMRLNVRERATGQSGPLFERVVLDHRILSANNVPLAWDVDGEEAASRNQQPFFSAPSLDSPVVFAQDRVWFPGKRHNGQANFAFADGHVDSSAQPLAESLWDWAYEPATNRR